MALDSSQFYKDPKTGTTYTSYDSYNQNVNGISLPTSNVDRNTGQQLPGANANTQGSTVAAPGGIPGANPLPPPNPPSVPGQQAGVSDAANQVQNLAQNVPNSYDLYQQELKSRGIDTLTQQEADLGNSANEQEKALKPLLPENVQFNFPGGLKQLQDIGVTQDQLNLLAAKERAPIASALSDLLKSQSIIAQQIDRQMAFSKYAVELKTNDYQNRMAAAELNNKMATAASEQAFKSNAEAQKFAIDNKITSQFYNLAGTVVRTSDGKRYSSPEEFFKDAGVTSFEDAASKGLIQTVDQSATTDLKDYPASYQEYLLAKQDGYKGSYNDYQTMDANRKRSISTTNNITSDATATMKLQVMQAPAQVTTLKNEGRSWGDIAAYFQALGIDPGTKEIDDALHRAFMDQKEYSKWKEKQ